MNKAAIKDLIYGGMTELMRNPKYYYNSTVNSTYNHWTEEGLTALGQYMNLLAGRMHEAELQELDLRARQLVITQLKSN